MNDLPFIYRQFNSEIVHIFYLDHTSRKNYESINDDFSQKKICNISVRIKITVYFVIILTSLCNDLYPSNDLQGVQCYFN